MDKMFNKDEEIGCLQHYDKNIDENIQESVQSKRPIKRRV